VSVIFNFKRKPQRMRQQLMFYILAISLFLKGCTIHTFVPGISNEQVQITTNVLLDEQAPIKDQTNPVDSTSTACLGLTDTATSDIVISRESSLANKRVDRIQAKEQHDQKEESLVSSSSDYILTASFDNIQQSNQHFELEYQRKFLPLIGKFGEESKDLDKQEVTSLDNLEILPIELLEKVTLYLTCEQVMNVRQVNRLFYELTTGYTRPGLIGVEHKPNRSINLEACGIKRLINFKQLKPETIPSFPFYQFIREVYNLPDAFWPYLRETNIQLISLQNNAISEELVIEFVQNLQGTKVHTLNMSDNNIGHKCAEEIAKHLQGTNVYILGFAGNNIGGIGVVRFIRNLQGTKVRTVNLNSNCIGSEKIGEVAESLKGTKIKEISLRNNCLGAVGSIEFARNLQGTQVNTVNLSNNQMGDEGVIGAVRNLQGTQVNTIDLSSNLIEALGAAQLAGYLQSTQVCTINLSYNKIKGKDIGKFAANLQGTKIHTINLGRNNIEDADAIEFAKNLSNTNVKAVNLSRNNIKGGCQYLLICKYPHIKWKF
jgi:Ran GTPase-activating protein (RanGAP) involved in mRNA processing and transport